MVKDFFDFYVNPNEKELFEKYRNKVFEAFFPKRGFKLKFNDGKRAISDFKKLGTSSEYLADFMLFYVETGVQFTNDYGDINEGFYSSIEKTFLAALTLMRKENILDEFANCAAKVMRDTSSIGWGFHEYLEEIYSDFYTEPR